MESRIPPIAKSQRKSRSQAQTKKATRNTKHQGGKSQLIRSKSRNLKIKTRKNQPEKPKHQTQKNRAEPSRKNPKPPVFEAKSLYFR